MNPETIGQRAYAAFRDSMGGRHLGHPMLDWADLSYSTRQAWECSAGTIRRDTLREITAILETYQGEAGV